MISLTQIPTIKDFILISPGFQGRFLTISLLVTLQFCCRRINDRVSLDRYYEAAQNVVLCDGV